MEDKKIPFEDWFRVEIWLVELQSMLECDAIIQPQDVRGIYKQKAKEIKEFLEKY